MQTQRKKELLQAYRDRKPEMGVISVRCNPTGKVFLGVSKDTRADYNSIQAKLRMNSHPNKALQALWNTHGEAQFTLSLLAELHYDDPHDDHSRKLEELRQQYLDRDPAAEKLWR